jgi:2-amino-4-hydroxy-6-hydroxymethyldihydropteridine diphosphokinase
MPICYLGLGSNSGNRKRNIQLALNKINALIDTKVLKVAKLLNSKPVGGPAGQPDFLNSAAKISTGFTPHALLKKLQNIEVALGRPKKHARFARRTIDLDILFYADKVINTKKLTVPHPRLFEREFVLKTLLEII